APAAVPAPASPGSGGAVATARPAAALPAEPEAPPPRPPVPQPRVPLWAMPVLIALPFWAIMYAGAFGERGAVEDTGPLAVGARVYRSAGCSGCHGATGGGNGPFPPLTGTLATFPNEADHIEWVKTGSGGVRGQTYGSGSRVATGGMPGFADSLSEEEIIAVVAFERQRLAG
ncbi:MAG: c-type cytochrome, partial [Acidimicrobiales bacterium]